VVSGGDDQVSFRLYKTKEKVVFEVIVDELIFKNSTGDWTNSLIMLENAIRKNRRRSRKFQNRTSNR
jgi:hypothetical protein